MTKLLALSFLLPLAGMCGEVKTAALSSIGNGSVLRTEDCNGDPHPCYALVLNAVRGKDTGGADVSIGDLLLDGAWSRGEAADDLTFLAIATGKTTKPGLKVELASFRYGVSAAPLSAWTRRSSDAQPVRRARVVITTVRGDTATTIGLGTAQ